VSFVRFSAQLCIFHRCLLNTLLHVTSPALSLFSPLSLALSSSFNLFSSLCMAYQRARLLKRGAREGRGCSAGTYQGRDGSGNNSGTCLTRSSRMDEEEGTGFSIGRIRPPSASSSSSRVARSRSASGMRHREGDNDEGNTSRRAPVASFSSSVVPLHDAWSSLSLGGAAAASVSTHLLEALEFFGFNKFAPYPFFSFSFLIYWGHFFYPLFNNCLISDTCEITFCHFFLPRSSSSSLFSL